MEGIWEVINSTKDFLKKSYEKLLLPKIPKRYTQALKELKWNYPIPLISFSIYLSLIYSKVIDTCFNLASCHFAESNYQL